MNVDICEVKLRQVGVEEDLQLPFFSEVYSTPSKIKFSNSSKNQPFGIEYTYKIVLQYPGLSEIDFSNFHKLLHEKYVLQLKYSSNATYQVGSNDIALKLSVSYKNPKGTVLTFSNKSIEPIKELGVLIDEDLVGFPYRLKAEL